MNECCIRSSFLVTFHANFQQALIATTVIRQMQRMALSSGSSSGGRSPVPERSSSTGEQCGNVNGAEDK